jgi:ankyrin repeat protein
MPAMSRVVSDQIAFARAVHAGDADAVRAALDRGADPTEALSQCASAEVARVLIAAGASPDYPPDDPPIVALAQHGHADALAVVIAAKADLEASRRFTEMRALMTAALHGQLAAVTMLIAAGAYVNARDLAGQTALHHVATSTHRQRRAITIALLEAGADRSARTRRGDTALDLARAAGHSDVIDLLAL